MNNTFQSSGLGISSPPLARLTLRVGITGHRANNLRFANEDLLRSEIKTVLEFLKTTTNALYSKARAFYADDPPLLRVISPLAEGADRLLVEVANTLGNQFEVQCALPFSQVDYEQDFETSDSVSEFRGLLEKATSLLELDGSRESSESLERAYEAVGRIVLDHSDVVVTIWDGEPGQRGGTGQVANSAELLNIPLVWINSKSPHLISIKVNQGDDWLPWDRGAVPLAEKLSTLVLPPEKTKASEKQRSDLLTAYFHEKDRRSIFGSLWVLFRNLFAGKVLVAAGAITSPTLMPQAVSDQIDTALGNHYRWADRLADYYANVYRSAFVFNYLISAFAVLFAFLGHWVAQDGHEEARIFFTIAEVIIIVAVIMVTVVGLRRRWHERWIDYRLLAEHLRQTQFLMLLGRASVSLVRFPIYISYGDPRNSWMYWHLQAIVRDSGMIRLKFDSNYLQTLKDFLYENIRGQISYHQHSAKIIETLNHRLHIFGLCLFFLAFGSALLHFVVHDKPWSDLLTTLTIVGPSFGAALAAIRSQGEFDRLTKSSRAMSSQLESFSRRLAAVSLSNRELSSARLGEMAVEGTQLMVRDVLNWRLVVEEQPLELPS